MAVEKEKILGKLDKEQKQFWKNLVRTDEVVGYEDEAGYQFQSWKDRIHFRWEVEGRYARKIIKCKYFISPPLNHNPYIDRISAHCVTTKLCWHIWGKGIKQTKVNDCVSIGNQRPKPHRGSAMRGIIPWIPFTKWNSGEWQPACLRGGSGELMSYEKQLSLNLFAQLLPLLFLPKPQTPISLKLWIRLFILCLEIH